MQQSTQTKTLSEPCEGLMEEVVSPVIEVPLRRDAMLHAAQRFDHSSSSWYAGRFEEGEEHAAEEDELESISSKHTQASSRHPQQSQEMSRAARLHPRKIRAKRCEGGDVSHGGQARCEVGGVLYRRAFFFRGRLKFGVFFEETAFFRRRFLSVAQITLFEKPAEGLLCTRVPVTLL